VAPQEKENQPSEIQMVGFYFLGNWTFGAATLLLHS